MNKTVYVFVRGYDSCPASISKIIDNTGKKINIITSMNKDLVREVYDNIQNDVYLTERELFDDLYKKFGQGQSLIGALMY